MKEEILKEITNYYLNSGDFNGLPLYELQECSKEIIFELIDEEKVEVLSSSFVINPHIKAFSLNIDKEIQKSEIEISGTQVVLYPTEKHLKSFNYIIEKPFTKMIADGQGQLNIIYFNIEILESYFQDPRYKIFWSGYRGSIIVSDEFYEDDEIENEYIKDFGIGYNKVTKERVAGVFLGDLSKLSLIAQLKWKISLLDNQSNYLINSGFYKNLILGEFVDEVSIYDAILDEIIAINEMCDNMKIPHLFSKTYKPHDYEKPEGFRIIFLPTLKNYYLFVQELEKMFIHNINFKTFTVASRYICPVNRKNDNGELKGSLQMFSEWINCNIKTNCDTEKDIIGPLKTIRKERQVPAHELYSNKYDKSLYKKQNVLIGNTYSAIRNIRLLFTNYPGNRKVEIPNYLVTGENIIIY